MTREDTLQISFKHFSYRLAERYDLFITFEFYKVLCELPYLKKQKLHTGKLSIVNEGYLTIQGVEVKCWRNIGFHKQLLTVIKITKKVNKIVKINCKDCKHLNGIVCNINKKNGYHNCNNFRAISIQQLEKEKQELTRSGENKERLKILTEKLNKLNGWC